MKVLRAIYSCTKSALLWYHLYVKPLKGLGFKLNSYNKYEANKMIDGKQFPLAWYVDDNKMAHEDKYV